MTAEASRSQRGFILRTDRAFAKESRSATRKNLEGIKAAVEERVDLDGSRRPASSAADS